MGAGGIERACGPAAVRRAIEHYDQALTVSREIGDRRNEGALLDNLGLPHAELNMTAKALDLWQEALRIFEEIESPHIETVAVRWLISSRNVFDSYQSELQDGLVVDPQMVVGAVALAGAGHVHAPSADEAEHEQCNGVPVGDLLEHASANVVLHVQHEDPAWFQHAPAFGPDRHVQRAVLSRDPSPHCSAPEFPGVSGRPSVCR